MNLEQSIETVRSHLRYTKRGQDAMDVIVIAINIDKEMLDKKQDEQYALGYKAGWNAALEKNGKPPSIAMQTRIKS